MHLELLTLPGSPERPNEDLVSAVAPAAALDGCLVLLDGVTPPAGEYGCRHTVPWFVAHLGGALSELAATRRDMTLTECLAEAIERTASRHAGTCDLSHPRTPQATVVIARWDTERVEHLVLSDSVLLVGSPGQAVHVVRDDRLTYLPEPVPTLRARIAELPADSPERAQLRREHAAAVEGLRNATGGAGFYTAAGDPASARYAVVGERPRRDVATLLALSDGASRWSEVFRLGDWDQLHALVAREGPRALLDEVRAAERADPETRRYPRGKRHDDASVVFAQLPGALAEMAG